MLSADSQVALAIYFDLAREELYSPQIKRTFVDVAGARRVDSIESVALQAAVGRYQQDSANIKSRALAEGSERERFQQFPASGKQRFAAALVDLSGCALIAIVCAALRYVLSSSAVASAVLGDDVMPRSDLYTIALSALTIFPILHILVLPLLRALTGATPGEQALRLRLTKADSAPLSLGDSIAWALLAIFSWLSLGLLEGRRRRISWREKLLGAHLLRTSSD